MSKWENILGALAGAAGAVGVGVILGIINSELNMQQNDEEYTTITLYKLAIQAYENTQGASQKSQEVDELLDEAYDFYADALPGEPTYASLCKQGDTKLNEAIATFKKLPKYQSYLDKARKRYQELLAQQA